MAKEKKDLVDRLVEELGEGPIFALNAERWEYIHLSGEITQYQVSDRGRVRNTITDNILRSSMNENGYMRINLVFNSKNRKYIAAVKSEWKDKLGLPNVKLNPRRSDNLRNRVVELFDSGITDYGVILERLGIPDTRANRKYLASTKNAESMKVARSTTIPNTSTMEKYLDTSKEEVHPQAYGGPLEELKVG